MKKRLLPFFLLIIIHSTYAQDSSFQLKNYKYRTPGFTALELNLGFSGAVSDVHYENLNQIKQSNFQLFPSNLTYFHTKNTDKRIQTSTVRFYPAGGHSSFEQNDSSSKANVFQYALYWNFNNRFYKRNNWFWELGNNLHHSLATNNSKDKTNKINNNNLLAENTVTLGFGKGRIEMVRDAQMALYILNDLKEAGLLSSVPSPEITRQFAQLITDINTKRVFDDRRKRIYEFTMMDSFLKTSGLISLSDIRYFAILNDNWVMAYNPNRLSGSNWYVRLSPGAGIQKDNSDVKSTVLDNSLHNKLTYANLTPQIGYESYTPVNLKWQQNFIATISYSKQWNSTDMRSEYGGIPSNFKIDTKEWKTELNTLYGWGYFPNNRTAVYASVKLDASYGKMSGDINDKELRSIKPGFQLSADYFISYRTRFNAYLDANYQSTRVKSIFNETRNWHNFYSGFSVGLSHTIF
jgi:hypothetical protein